MNHQAEIIMLAAERGMQVSQLTEAEYRSLALEVRSLEEVVVDGVRMQTARVKSKLGWALVLPQIREANLAKCRQNKCQSYKVLADGAETCLRCNCSGRDLAVKAEQSNEYCPAPVPYWDNRKVGKSRLVPEVTKD